jgi:hypothetical protein
MQHKAKLNMPGTLLNVNAKFCQNSCNRFEDKTRRQMDRLTQPPIMHSIYVLCAKNTFKNPVTPHAEYLTFTVWE